MSRPKEIAAIEKAYGITLKQKDKVWWHDRNCYALNSDGAVVALSLRDNQIQEIPDGLFHKLTNLTTLQVSQSLMILESPN